MWKLINGLKNNKKRSFIALENYLKNTNIEMSILSVN